MAQSEIEYTTADGNDYKEHEGTYVRFLDISFALAIYVICIVLGLAVIGTTHRAFIGVMAIVAATILAIPAFGTGSKSWSCIALGIGLLGFAVGTLG
jgi:hypothetical protein